LAAETQSAEDIVTPCWVHGADTVEDLNRVHVWHEMRALQLEQANAAADAHLRGLCQYFNGERVG
jgi:hypothetical protein